jgi:hypothetical protein
LTRTSSFVCACPRTKINIRRAELVFRRATGGGASLDGSIPGSGWPVDFTDGTTVWPTTPHGTGYVACVRPGDGAPRASTRAATKSSELATSARHADYIEPISTRDGRPFWRPTAHERRHGSAAPHAHVLILARPYGILVNVASPRGTTCTTWKSQRLASVGCEQNAPRQ